MNKNGFGINNLQWLIYHKTKPNQTKPNQLLSSFVYHVLPLVVCLSQCFHTLFLVFLCWYEEQCRHIFFWTFIIFCDNFHLTYLLFSSRKSVITAWRILDHFWQKLSRLQISRVLWSYDFRSIKSHVNPPPLKKGKLRVIIPQSNQITEQFFDSFRSFYTTRQQ